MQELDDITLKKAVHGDKHAFKALYNLYAPFLWRVIYRMAPGDQSAASELLQDTFVNIHRALHHFRGDATLSTWLYRITYTTVLKRRRLQIMEKRNVPCTNQMAGTESADHFDNRQLTDQILGSLATEERFLLVAREIDDLSFEEIAAITGKNSGALRTQLHRLKERIRQTFAKENLSIESEVLHEA